jgi:hypothetical protein
MVTRTRKVKAAGVNGRVQFELPFDSHSGADVLRNPRPVTIEARARVQKTVTMRRAQNGKSNRVYVDGRYQGLFDRFGVMTFTYRAKPIWALLFVLSDGQIVEVHEQELGVIAAWRRNPNARGKWYPVKSVALSTQPKMRSGKSLTWADAQTLSLGDVVDDEYPFQWVNGMLTNGVVSFPSQRPVGKAWASYPIPAVPANAWDNFLEGLEGKFMKDLIPFRQAVTKHGSGKPRLSPRQREVEAVVRGQMYKGQGGETIWLGRNVIFVVPRGEKSTLFFVDNPGVGALYVFYNLTAAQEFAKGNITRRQAIAGGAKRIVHAGDWQGRAAHVIAGT